MNKFKAKVLKAKIIPAIVMYGLLPRSITYIAELSILVLLSIILFAFFTMAYLFLRTRIVCEYGCAKKTVFWDSLLMVLGIAASCFISYWGHFNMLFCLTLIPSYINNHKVL